MRSGGASHEVRKFEKERWCRSELACGTKDGAQSASPLDCRARKARARNADWRKVCARLVVFSDSQADAVPADEARGAPRDRVAAQLIRCGFADAIRTNPRGAACVLGWALRRHPRATWASGDSRPAADVVGACDAHAFDHARQPFATERSNLSVAGLTFVQGEHLAYGSTDSGAAEQAEAAVAQCCARLTQVAWLDARPLPAREPGRAVTVR